MEQPPAGVAIQGLIRPAFMEEQSDIQRHMSGNQSHHAGTNQVGQSMEGKLEEPGVINGHEHKSGSSEDISLWREELEKDEVPSSGTSFYKLEMIKIQLISAHGHQVYKHIFLSLFEHSLVADKFLFIMEYAILSRDSCTLVVILSSFLLKQWSCCCEL
jgi:hypothetical protein